LAEPSIVGVHWFQYLDQPVSGRLLDGENGHLGLVGITDVPFQGFVEAVRKSNNQVADVLSKEAAKTKVQAVAADEDKGAGGNKGGGAGRGGAAGTGGGHGHGGGTR